MASIPTRPSQPEALSVAPLNSIPYVDPVASIGLSFEGNDGGDTSKPEETCKPSFVLLPSDPTDEELDNIFSSTENAIVLTGGAAVGTMGPPVGKLDISESEDTYYFRVSLPGVAREDFTCDVAPDGHILIKGVTTTGEKTVYRDSMKFEMLTQNLSPPGPFSISYMLPGPVISQELTAHFGADGVFEGVVKKNVA